ncbi:VWA domain-containing protein [Streptomyces alkaliterrae]|uniref:VWA domain-containing protein n=1 Tax=Streptomyces alkaliterrae TaxID=2213162 RepID=A0A5P0YUB1_9ACTN|nr:VWA domain-containing protein [Streptomyces alkaliterrae]MBB1259162.1 VWA domain-containing protein [Streptomyces alkaliterrae]MQS02059.1 VWA domain-containing protein [Streptomyces alkaliterrae]
MIIGRRSAAALCAMLVGLVAAGLPGSAAAEPVGEDAPPPKVNLVLDVSGSMRAKDVGGQSRMAAAQQAFNEVIDAVPDGVHLGIRTLGANYPGENKKLGCVDSEALYPVGEVDKTEAKTAVATLRPTGWTPIGYALRGAVKDLGDGEGSRRIVLITDGEDSCGQPDPCDVARELAAKGTQLTVDTLGLAADDKVRRQLGCIAEATGGTYTSVQDTDQLSDRLKQLVRRSADTPLENPAPAEGGERCADAPLLTSGVYSDRAEFGQHRWYQVELQPGQELRAALSVAADRAVDRDYAVLLRAVSERGTELVRGREAGSGRTDVLSTGLRYPWNGEEERTVCLEASHAFSAPASVQRTPGLPVELTVDVVEAADTADVAFFGLARGWIPVLLLTVTGLAAGLLAGLIGRLRNPVRRA